MTTAISTGGTAPSVLVIGGAGYIGSVLVRQLLAAGYHVTVFDRLFYGSRSIAAHRDHPRFRLIVGDTRHVEDVMAAVRDKEIVIHLAELVGDPLCARDPATTFQINFLATSSVAQACHYLGIPRFVYISSCSVYGASSDPDAMLDERSEVNPLSLYAEMKLRSEAAIADLVSDGLVATILRLGTVFGYSPRPRLDLVVNTLSAQAAHHGTASVFGGDQWRPHVHVEDVARAIRAVIDTPVENVRGQVYNVVGQNLRIADVGQTVGQIVSESTVHFGTASGDMRNYRVSAAKIHDELGFSPSRMVSDGIREIARAIEGGIIADIDLPIYSNVKAFSDPPATFDEDLARIEPIHDLTVALSSAR